MRGCGCAAPRIITNLYDKSEANQILKPRQEVGWKPPFLKAKAKAIGAISGHS
jgi:hypothetical protein